MPKKVLHIVTATATGGGEMMLLRIVDRSRNTEFEPEVISLTTIGEIGERIRDLGIPIRELKLQKAFVNPFALFKLIRWVRESKPDIVQTWMYHGDLLGGVAAKIVGKIPVAWNIQNSNLSKEGSRRTTIWISNICAWISKKLPSKILCCSYASRDVHAEQGYDRSKMVVIANGTDIDEFKPDPEARTSVREELNLSPDAVLIGIAARFDPQKDFGNFVRAAGIVAKDTDASVRFVLCGQDVDEENEELVGWIRENGVEDRCHLLGRRADTPRIMAALDILTISSCFGEGFPLVSGEAMASGVPMAVTEIGDSPIIVGDTGRSVPPEDSDALGAALLEMVKLGPDALRDLGLAARERIKNEFSLEISTEKYHAVYREMLGME